MKRIKLNWQIFVSLYILFSFVIVAFTGVVLYFAPHGRVAYWSYWKFLGLQKEDWQAVHTTFTFIFVFAAILHIYFNWSSIKLYLTARLKESFKYGNEIAFSMFFVFLIFFGSALQLPPIDSVMEFGEYLSESWSNENTEPPVPHAEDLTLRELAITMKTDPKVLVANLEKSGIVVLSEDEVLKEISDRNLSTPARIYAVLNKSASVTEHIKSGLGGGYGRLTVKDLCEKNGISADEAIKRLMARGIPAESGNKIRDVALDHKMQPVQIVEIILEKKLINGD